MCRAWNCAGLKQTGEITTAAHMESLLILAFVRQLMKPAFADGWWSLGAVLDLTRADCGEIIVKNKGPKELLNLSRLSLSLQSPPKSMLLKVRGQILFSRSLCFGRFPASALKAVNACCAAADACRQKRVQEPLVGDLHAAMLLLAKVLRDSLFERELSFASNHLDRCGIRACQWPALHYSRWRVARQGCKRPRVLQPGRHRKVRGTQNPIVEAAPLAVFLHAWRSRVTVLGSVDNEGASRQSLRGAQAASLLPIALTVSRLEIDLHLVAWWERVPSKINLGDPFGARAAKRRSQAHESKYILVVLSGLSLRGRWKSFVCCALCRVVSCVVCRVSRVSCVVSCVVCRVPKMAHAQPAAVTQFYCFSLHRLPLCLMPPRSSLLPNSSNGASSAKPSRRVLSHCSNPGTSKLSTVSAVPGGNSTQHPFKIYARASTSHHGHSFISPGTQTPSTSPPTTQPQISTTQVKTHTTRSEATDKRNDSTALPGTHSAVGTVPRTHRGPIPKPRPVLLLVVRWRTAQT